MHFDVRGLRLNALERGSGEPVLLLHGWLDHAHSFDRLAPLLPGRPLALDWRGHGDSAWAPEAGYYHMMEYVADLDRVVELSGATRIVGHSMGATVALLYAAARPARVRHVTMIDGAPFTVAPGEVPARVAAWLDDLRKPRTRRRVESVEGAAARLVRFNPTLPADIASLLAQHGVSADGDALAWKWDPWLRGHSPLPMTEDVLQALVAEVRAPVLLIRGEKGMTPDEADLRARLARIPSLRIETIPGAGHHLHLEDAAAVAKLITRAWEGQGHSRTD